MSVPNPQSARLLATASLIAVMALGCGGAPPLKLAPGTGVVTINGKPAPNILVQFMPQVGINDPGPTSSGVTDDVGKFVLKTSDGQDGVLVGTCKVLLADLLEERPPQGVAVTKRPRLTARWQVLGPQTLEVVVAESDNKPFEIAVAP
jgi:hypothetical protein